jgi:hypothetical protein
MGEVLRVLTASRHATGIRGHTPPVHVAAAIHAALLPNAAVTYLFQHGFGVVEVMQHGLDIGLVGGPLQEPPKGSLGALHGEGVRNCAQRSGQ